MGFEMPSTPEKPKAAFPELVVAVQERWSQARSQAPEGESKEATAKIVADRLNEDQGYLFLRRQQGIEGAVTAQEVLATYENHLKS